jgi:hypothetical protein
MAVRGQRLCAASVEVCGEVAICIKEPGHVGKHDLKWEGDPRALALAIAGKYVAGLVEFRRRLIAIADDLQIDIDSLNEGTDKVQAIERASTLREQIAEVARKTWIESVSGEHWEAVADAILALPALRSDEIVRRDEAIAVKDAALRTALPYTDAHSDARRAIVRALGMMPSDVA